MANFRLCLKSSMDDYSKCKSSVLLTFFLTGVIDVTVCNVYWSLQYVYVDFKFLGRWNSLSLITALCARRGRERNSATNRKHFWTIVSNHPRVLKYHLINYIDRWTCVTCYFFNFLASKLRISIKPVRHFACSRTVFRIL